MSGDYKLEDSVYLLFTTRAFATGIPGVLSASTVAVYEDVTATPIETAIAVTETLNSINGLNAVTIAALAASGYNAGGHYHVVIEAGTVDSVSVVGEVVGQFTIQANPVNWAKVTAPTTAVDLSATDIQLVDTVTTYTGNTLQTGDTYALANGAAGFVAIDTVVDAILVDTAEIGTAGAGLTNIGTIATVTTLTGHTAQTGDTYALANGAAGFVAIDTVVDSILVDTGTTIPATITTAQADLDIITGISGVNLLTATQASIDAIEADTNELQTDWADGGRLDNLLDGAASAGDPWTTALPGAYGAGTAGKIIGDNINAPLNTIDTVVDSILVDTAEIGAAGAGLTALATAASIAALNDVAATDIVSAGAITTLTGAIVNVDLVDTVTTYTGNTLQTGDTYALANGAAGFVAIDTVVDAILVDTADIQPKIGTPAADVSADIAAVKVDTAATLVDTGTTIPGTITTLQADTDDIQTRLPAALIGGRMDSDVEAINNSTTAAVQLALSAAQIESGAAEGTPSTTVIQTDLAESQDDVYIGRVVIFTSGTARGEATDITDYVGSTGTITVTALASAPAAADTFILI